MFALGSQFHSKRALDGTVKILVNRAGKLLAPFMLGSCSLRLVQALLLLGIHVSTNATVVRIGLLISSTHAQYQSSNHPSSCWSVIGHAVRLAHALGLHLDVEAPSTYDAPRREFRRRIWTACFILDR